MTLNCLVAEPLRFFSSGYTFCTEILWRNMDNHCCPREGFSERALLTQPGLLSSQLLSMNAHSVSLKECWALTGQRHDYHTNWREWRIWTRKATTSRGRMYPWMQVLWWYTEMSPQWAAEQKWQRRLKYLRPLVSELLFKRIKKILLVLSLSPLKLIFLLSINSNFIKMSLTESGITHNLGAQGTC